MKKFLFMLPFLAAVCLGFASCSEDDEIGGSINSQLVGVWEEVDEPDEYFTWEFKSNGTFIWYYTYNGNKEVEDTGKFKTNGNKLYFIVNEDGEEYTLPFTYEFDGEYLLLYDLEEEDGWHYTCKRVK